MEGSKIQLSPYEMSLVLNPEVLLTKNRIIIKVSEFFGNLAEQYSRHILSDNNPIVQEAAAIPAKVSKGENFRGLPYVVLDYPRVFGRNDVFAIRTMFWWGNFFSITLQLKGSYKENLQERIGNNLLADLDDDIVISNSDDEWEHDSSGGHYIQVKNFAKEDLLLKLSDDEFIKLSMLFPLQDLNEAGELLQHKFSQILRWLKL